MPIRYHFENGKLTPKQALEKLAKLSFGDITHPQVLRAARQVVSRIGPDEDAELDALFRAVKQGDPNCPALARGIVYKPDPPHIDLYTKPSRLLTEALQGANCEDCDGHAALLAALCGAVGWVPGLRIVGADPTEEAYTHVYAVVGYPKGQRPDVAYKALDTTVEESFVGWEPPVRCRLPPMTAVLNLG